MKKVIIPVVVLGFLLLAACNSNSNQSEGHDMSKMDTDTMQPAPAADAKEPAMVAVTYTGVDVKVAGSIKAIVDQYLLLKNELAKDNGSGAASAAKDMNTAIGKLDKSLLTAEQKKLYDDYEDDLKEHAEHIGSNGDKIKHQRDHFSSLSEDIYALIKAFGGGRAIYHDHCPMYNENKGAMWLSETKEIKNPYMGAAMPTCGSVEEVIK
jgi:predicted small secreted protein